MKRKFSDEQQKRGNVRDLLVRGVAAAKAGEGKEARFYLEWVLIAGASEDQLMEAWLWLAEVSEGAQKRRYLEEILSRRPAHARARRQLAILDGRLQAEEIVDPETLRVRGASDEEPGQATARQFRCPRCDSRLVFTPDGASLHCEHCGYRQAPEDGAAVEETDFIVTMATTRGHLQPGATATFSCRSCSASFLLAPGTLTVTCPYCHHAYAVETSEMRELAPPQGVIPFAVDEGQATRRVRAWLAEHKLRPHAAPQGVYLPAWTFDVGGGIDWQGQVPSHENGMQTWRTETGSAPIFEDDIVVAACKTLPKAVAPLLGTYDLDAVVGFDASFLASWPAQTYEIAAGDASLAARKQAYERGKRDVRHGVDGVSNLRFSSAGITIVSHKLLLLPVWVAHYGFEGQVYMLAANGQNGSLQPERTPSRGLLGSLERWLGGKDS